MEGKRLDLNAPLLSVRRIAAPPPAAAAAEDSSSSSSYSSGTFFTPRAEEIVPSAFGAPPIKKSSPLLYSSELKSGQVGSPVVVPFLWERTPGQPKGAAPSRPPAAPKLPPGRFLNENDSDGSIAAPPVPNSSDGSLVREKRKVEEEEEESFYDDDGDGFSDGRETLSLTESFFRDCSVSGHSGSPDAAEPSGTFSKDPQVQDFMMGRFLPAAQAVATGSLQPASWKKPPATQPREAAEKTGGGYLRRPIPLSYSYQQFPNVVSRRGWGQEDGESYDDDDEEEEEEEEEEEDYGGSGHLGSKACGLIPRFCLKSSFFLLNPVPGMKVRSQLPPRPGRKFDSRSQFLDHGSLGQVEDEHSWEAVYRYKLGRENAQREDGSKLTSESNQLTFWTDSQTADGSSSPYHHSVGGEIPPYGNEAPQSAFHEGRGFLGVPKRELKSWKSNSFDSFEKIGESCLEKTPHRGRHYRSSSMSPSVGRNLYMNSGHMLQNQNVKSSQVDTAADAKGGIDSARKNSEVAVESQRMGQSIFLQTCEKDAAQPKFSEVVEPDLSSYSERSQLEEEKDGNGLRKHGSDAVQLSSKVDDQEKGDACLALALLPPPLPKSPSESWLQRTLPSVSSKNTSPQSFLSIQFQHRKQASPSSVNDLKRLTNVKPSRHTIGR